MEEDRKADYKKCEDAAYKVLSEHGVFYTNKPSAIKLALFCEGLGLTVLSTDEFEEDQSGLFDFDQNKIFINSKDPKYRKRFTVAHELGHFILHQELKERHQFIERRKPLSYQKPWYEKEADAFAAHLLVPLKLLKKEKKKYELGTLSYLFQVSDEVITYQLKRL